MELPPLAPDAAASSADRDQLQFSDSVGASTGSEAFAKEKSRRAPAQRNAPGPGRRKSITWSVVDTVKYIANSLSGVRSSQSGADIAAAAAAAASLPPAEPRGSILRRSSHAAGDAIIEMLKNENLDLTDVITAAQEEADCRTSQAIEAATAKRRAFRSRGFASRGKAVIIVIINRTAAKLMIIQTKERVKSEIGYIYEKSAVPQSIGPGKAASFLHVTDCDTTKRPRGTLTYAIHVFKDDEGRADPWVNSGRYLSFQWDSNKNVKVNANFTSSGSVEDLSNTGTRYDGLKIYGAAVNRETSKKPVYAFTFSHEEVEVGDVESQGGEGGPEGVAKASKSSRCIVM
eukprot:CAMPEP_0178543398 /NCGR_PEP_ID=MMETSP0697-20121206/2565_1 /TAXON_ID=265572 /ORGANISM="Extubocellulus spinifer, Strain CCMP396" /LENGTH=344 /DNA_ID=CAMNT_0020175851 /DNA_START=11 /DNA_END=1045 /DNA_ORIENTATION=+